jgi:anti-sigma factor RsiW
MSDIDDDALREQLSRWLDGDLPEQEARFFARRVQADPGLAALARRWREAGALLREPRWRQAAPELAARISALVAAEASPPARRRGWATWAAAAAVAALALGLTPRILGPESASQDTVLAQRAAPASVPAPEREAPVVAPATPTAPTMMAPSLPLAIAVPQAPSREMSPVGAQDPISEFALVLDDSPRAWPRSPLLAGGGDPAAHSVSALEPER